MKSLYMVVAFVFILCASAFASDQSFLLVSDISTTITGTAQHVPFGFKTWNCDVQHTGPTALVVRIEGNQGDTSHFSPVSMMTITCAAGELTAGMCSGSIADKIVRNIRAVISTLTTAGTATVNSIVCTGTN